MIHCSDSRTIQWSRYNRGRAALSDNLGMAGLRRVLHHSVFLVDGSSASRRLASSAQFALLRADSGVGRDVGGRRGHHVAMADGASAHELMGLGSRDRAIRHRNLALQTSGCQLRMEDTRRNS